MRLRKSDKIQPKTVSQACKGVSGVSPIDISVLLVYMGAVVFYVKQFKCKRI